MANTEKGDTGIGAIEAEFSTSAFEALERDFQEVLADLVGDDSLSKFREEYEKLHRALKKSHDQEKRLVKMCRELNTEIVNNAAKVQYALQLAQKDDTTIASLRKEIEKAWAMVDVSHEKEVRAKDTINQLKDEIANLSKLVEKGAGLSVGQENMVKELLRVRDELQRQTEEQGANVKVLGDQLRELHKQNEALGAEKFEISAKIETQTETIASRDAEISREHRRRERMDKELRDLRTKLDKKAAEQESVSQEVGVAKTQVGQLEKQLTEARATMEKYLRDYDTLYQRTQKLTEDLEEQMEKTGNVHADYVQSQKELKLKTDDCTRLATEKSQMERKVDREHKSAQRYKQLLDNSKTPLLMAQQEVQSLKNELEIFKRRENSKNKEVDILEREKNLQLTQIQKVEDNVKTSEDKVRQQERAVSALENQLAQARAESVKKNELIHTIEKEREKYGNEASEERKNYLKAMEEVKLKQSKIEEGQKKIAEGEMKLKQQQQLYESVRSDRNLYSKNLIESQDEIAEMKRKFKIMNHQIEQLKEEISAKDSALVKEHFDHQKVQKQREQQRNEISRMKRLGDQYDNIIHKQDAEIRRLASMIRRMDEEALTQRKEYDQVINERDILGTQLIRRNDELALLYEKLKIQQSTLRKGEAQYAQRVEDIRIMKLKIKDLQREAVISKGNVVNVDGVRRELMHKNKELLQEKTKVKALSEELENPMNVHRWRKLEGSDPATYEMIQKIQTLQQRLIKKTEEVVEKDMLIQEKERLYLELKKILARQPGPEVAEQLSVYQSSLKEKTRQMKAMASELNMFQAQSSEYKYEIERLTRELQDVKRKFYEQKRREALAREMEEEENVLGRSQARKQVENAQKSTTRFTGGGFAIK
ncbi:hypothetical protein TL16_g02641 [Triparma laevis f. inornata]|uniref:Cilia- and flagella-associated protein 58 central coiled coil domain-containing protein n=1 Tax=Triparma laevis f. inornata TaxID=1714386 RepID=A0A9W7E1F5_9STRA|nr:hypothetical protein TL16_g02641 [Triparma laevis f. inornata]